MGVHSEIKRKNTQRRQLILFPCVSPDRNKQPAAVMQEPNPKCDKEHSSRDGENGTMMIPSPFALSQLVLVADRSDTLAADGPWMTATAAAGAEVVVVVEK